MTTYAVGDVQGCLLELELLLRKIHFGSSDRIVFLGDLVNRGPDSLGVLRLVRSLGSQAIVVLGNHDLHLLAILFGGHRQRPTDTLKDIVDSPDAEDIGHWLRKQKLIYRDPTLGYLMVHAGIPHFWSVDQALHLASEVEGVIGGTTRDSVTSYQDFFSLMYGDQPNYWSEELIGMDRYRVVTNFLTRMRFLGANHQMDFDFKGDIGSAPEGLYPWYAFYDNAISNDKLLFGHWASLNGNTGSNKFLALDTGCVWGRALTGYCLETGETIAVPSSG